MGTAQSTMKTRRDTEMEMLLRDLVRESCRPSPCFPSAPAERPRLEEQVVREKEFWSREEKRKQMDAQSKFEGWALVELFGHQKEVGFVTTQYFGNVAMFQLDVPELVEREFELPRPEFIGGAMCPRGTKVKRPPVAGRSRLINPSAIYALNPCSEEAARSAIESMHEREVVAIDKPQAALPPPDEIYDPYDHMGEEEEEVEENER